MWQPERKLRWRGGLSAILALLCVSGVVWALGGCQPAQYREEADEVAYTIIEMQQEEALGRTEPFTIERPADTLRRRLIGVQGLPIVGPESLGADQITPIEHWPEEDYPAREPDEDPVVPPWDPAEPLTLSLVDALQVAARNSRDYQSQKEQIFRSALDLDLEALEFRTTYFGLIEGLFTSDQRRGVNQTAVEGAATLEARRRLQSGALLTGRLGLDLARLLSNDGETTLGILADASVTIPLLRGAGRHIVREPLTQAERDVIYAIWNFEEFKRAFAVNIASAYFSVLQNEDRVMNAEENYRSLILTTREQRALAEEGRRSLVELDQARQNELRARTSWISAVQSYRNSLDEFKTVLGLPADARLELDRAELDRLINLAADTLVTAEAEDSLDVELQLARGMLRDAFRRISPQARLQAVVDQWMDDMERALAAAAPAELLPPDPEEAGPYELDEDQALQLAFDNRLDLRIDLGEVYDAQRRVVVAANALQAGLNIVGDASTTGQYRLGTAGETVPFRFDRGIYSAGFELDLPFERTAERNLYRDAFIRLEQATRAVEDTEDTIKLDIRRTLRQLERAREEYAIQSLSVELAERRVDMTTLLLQVDRAQTRDLLEAQADLLAAQNSLTAAVIDYRLLELGLQRDLGVLVVDATGLWEEFDVESLETEG